MYVLKHGVVPFSVRSADCAEVAMPRPGIELLDRVAFRFPLRDASAQPIDIGVSNLDYGLGGLIALPAFNAVVIKDDGFGLIGG